MRIIHLSYNVPKPAYTDPEAWLKRISFSVGVMESMSQYGEIIGIYHIHHKGVLRKNGVTYHFPGYNRWQLLLPFQFNRYVSKLLPDVVIVHGLIFPWQVIMLRLQIGKHLKIIAQHHAERPLRDIRQYFQRWADRYIGAYLFASTEQGQHWVDQGQVKEVSKIKEVMGTSSFFFPMEKQVARMKTKVKGEKTFLWVGGLDANKDPLVVVRAFKKFTIDNAGASLYMIYQSFELLEELRSFVNTASLTSKIHLVGKVENLDLQYWYNSADFIISSSHYEGSGIAVCEAMSCGCIPILTNIPSFRMMTANGSIGILYDVGNVDALVSALQKSIQLNQEVVREKVLERFRNELSFEANARKIMQVINEIE